jgi:hypothetical protein
VTKPCRYLVFDLKVDAREDLLVWRRKSFQGEDDKSGVTKPCRYLDRLQLSLCLCFCKHDHVMGHFGFFVCVKFRHVQPISSLPI